MAATPVLQIDNVTRRFGRKAAVAGISVALAPGQIQAWVGPNGSGKSTLARLGVGLLRPHSGTVRVGGADPRRSPEARRQIGYLGHQSLLYQDLTPVANLRFVADLYRLDNPSARIEAILDAAGVGPERRAPVKSLSRGMVQRVALARSLLHAPALVIWDEPLTGLDQASAARAIDLIETARRGGTAAVVISHDLPELWRLAASVQVIHRGAIQTTAHTATPLEEFRTQYAEAIRD